MQVAIHYSGYELMELCKAHNYYSWIAQEYSSFVKGSVLEVGAGIGTFSEYLLMLSVKDLVCIEPSFNLASLLENRLDTKFTRIYCQTLEQFGAKNHRMFDTIVCINTLEHIKNDCQALSTMNKLLKMNGNLCLFIPAIPCLYGTLDEAFGHYRRYSKRQLGNLLVKSGFEVIKLRYFHISGIITWILMGKIRRRSAPVVIRCCI